MLLLTSYAIGLIFLFSYALSLCIKVCMRIVNRPIRPEARGEWAIVTGATDGIGKALAFELARRGMKILLVSRNENKLGETKQQIQSEKEGAEVDTVCMDFSELAPTVDSLNELAEKIKGKDIGLLINNAGVSYDHAMFLHEVPTSFIDELYKVNVIFPALLTQLVVNKFVTEKKKGAVVFVGSGSGSLPSDPLYSLYSSSKAAVEQLAKSLQCEYRKQQILFRCHIPLYVQTKMSKINKASFTIPSPSTFACSMLDSLDKSSIYDEASLAPFWPHAVMLKVVQFMPDALWGWFRAQQTEGFRTRWLKKNGPKPKTG